jgi:hypothetical protein
MAFMDRAVAPVSRVSRPHIKIEHRENQLRLSIDLVNAAVIVTIIDLIGINIIAPVLDRHAHNSRRDVLADPRITVEPVAGMQSGKAGIRNPMTIAIPTYPGQRRIDVAGAWIAAGDTDILREPRAAPKQDRIFRAADAIRHKTPFKPHKLAKLRAQLDGLAWRNPALAGSIVDLAFELSTISAVLAPLSRGRRRQ